jgi:hypothetical protein
MRRNGGKHMRMGTFLLGGIVGAVAVVYFNRNNSMLMTNISEAGQTVGNMVNRARNTMSNMDMMTSSSNQGMNSTARGTNTSTSGMNANSSNQNANSGMNTASENLSKVEEIVKKDPNLKNKVDEILKENKQSTSTYGMQ